MIRVLVVDDSSFIRQMVKQFLAEAGDIEVCGEAADGTEAIVKLKELKPDVVCLDLVMPVQDGLTSLRKIKESLPTPVIIFSGFFVPQAEIAAEAFRLGVVEAVQKPNNPKDIFKIKQELIEKIRIAGQIKQDKLTAVYYQREKDLFQPRFYLVHSVVAIGSSAGGPPAIEKLLASLPGNLASGILIGQHIPENFLEAFRYHLQREISFPVKIAEEGDLVSFGRVLVSPVGKTLTVESLKPGGVVHLVDSENRLKPSLDKLFESVAEVFNSKAIGVILSGMGEDGVKGLKAIKRAGGKVFAQDERTALVWGMPKAAFEAGVVDKVLPIEEIANEIVRTSTGRIRNI